MLQYPVISQLFMASSNTLTGYHSVSKAFLVPGFSTAYHIWISVIKKYQCPGSLLLSNTGFLTSHVYWNSPSAEFWRQVPHSPRWQSYLLFLHHF